MPHEGKWAVQSEGSKAVSSVYRTKQDAIDAAREIASREGASFLVHGKTGQIFYPSKVQGRLRDEEIRNVIRESSEKRAVNGHRK